MKAWQNALLSIGAGIVVGVGVAIAIVKDAQPAQAFLAQSVYYSSALQAQQHLKVLAYIDAGDTERARQAVDAMLLGSEGMLDSYAHFIGSSRIDADIQKARQQIAAYRASPRGFTAP